ncbi:MAG: rhomboid family intramembrane serine protease [Deltaproteobacteria bacterium]|nr:rhomboid family intramembrane serine protease [Deltaproteobacteria bacterium]
MIPLKDDNPTSSFPFVTLSLIAVNIAIFAYETLLPQKGLDLFIARTAAIPYEIAHLTDIQPAAIIVPPLTLLTAMFVHGGLFHVAGNMLYLWIFGDNIEDVLGHFKFLVFYLLTGLVASLTHILIDPHSTIPMIGASGAIAGVLGAYFLLFPRARVLTLVYLFFFVNVVRIPALLFLGLWFLIQVASSSAGGGIAWYAHIGGFAAGALAVVILRPKKRYRW